MLFLDGARDNHFPDLGFDYGGGDVLMTEGFVVDEGISRFGLRRIHVITPTKKGQVQDLPLREAWTMEKVGEGEIMAVLEYDDEDVRMHHLRIYWKDDGKERRFGDEEHRQE